MTFTPPNYYYLLDYYKAPLPVNYIKNMQKLNHC